MRFIIILLASLFLFNSCDIIVSGIESFSTIKEETKKQKREKEDKKFSKSVQKKNGEKKYLYENGNIKSVVNYKDGKKIGTSFTFYKSGEKQYDIPYVDGMKHGKVLWYYKSGKIYRETEYKKGKKSGFQRKYWESGKLKSEMEYHDNMLSIGLKEISNTGKVKSTPSIRVERIDRLKTAGEYILKMKLSNDRSKVEFFFGDLVDGKYIPEDGRGFSRMDVKKGVATFKFKVNRGKQVITDFKIIAIETTRYKNKRVITKNVPISIRNQ